MPGGRVSSILFGPLLFVSWGSSFFLGVLEGRLGGCGVMGFAHGPVALQHRVRSTPPYRPCLGYRRAWGSPQAHRVVPRRGRATRAP